MLGTGFTTNKKKKKTHQWMSDRDNDDELKPCSSENHIIKHNKNWKSRMFMR